MDQRAKLKVWRFNQLAATLGASTLLAACTTAQPEPPPSPVADPNAPMRVSTARVTSAAPDPVGQLFNDGPRQVVTYSVNTDPLAVLFRDPSFVVKLSAPASAPPPVRITSAPPSPPAAAPVVTSRSVAPATVTKPETVAAPAPEPQTRVATTQPTTPTMQRSMATAPQPREMPASEPVSVAQSTPQPASQPPSTSPAPAMTDASGTASQSQTSNAAPATVATAAVVTTAAVAPRTSTVSEPVASNEPVVLNGLKQKSAGWPLTAKPANVFGAKGPDGNAWRGLVYKSPAKTPVKAIEPGKVVFAQPLRGYGNVVIVDHGKQYTSIYGYNDSITKNVGDVVRKGDTIALVGDSGPLADEALYFEIRKGSVPIDPSLYLASNP